MRDEWLQGFFCACATVVKLEGETTTARELYETNYMSVVELRKNGIDNYDIDILRPLIKEIQSKRRRLNLKKRASLYTTNAKSGADAGATPNG